MHLLSTPRLNRLKANKYAWLQYEKRKSTYLRYSQTALGLSKTVPEYKPFENEETRVNFVKQMILTLDDSVYGLETATISADEIADSYARLIVGHEDK
jgi:hypothetical protein